LKIQELKRAKDQRPFLPFVVRMADGRELAVKHPDALAWYAENPRVAICATANGWEVLEVGLITSLSIQEFPPKRKGVKK
jgi:hypothetical protein